MKKMRHILAFLVMAMTSTGHASSPPKIIGTINVEPVSGLIAGNVCLENYPITTGGHFLLNSGFQIKHVRTVPAGPPKPYEGIYGGIIDGDARVYKLKDTSGSPICVEYLAAIPVYEQRDAIYDYKGRVASDGRVLRMTDQSKWLPTAYDPQGRRSYDEMVYDISIRCDECEAIYFPGQDPVFSSELRIISEVPRAPFLYAGKYSFRRAGPAWVLDSEINDQQMQDLSSGFDRVVEFYEQYLGIRYGDAPVLIEFDPVEPFPKDRSWAFVNWPVIAYGGVPLSEISDNLSVKPGSPGDYVVPLIGHEAAHYYFGVRNQPFGPYKQFFIESGAEFLSFLVTKEMQGEAGFRRRIEMRAAELFEQPSQVVPIDKISVEDAAKDVWRYSYGSLILLSMHDILGEDAARKIVAAMAESQRTPQTWEEMELFILSTGIDPSKWSQWRARCLDPAIDEGCLRDYRRKE